MKQWFQTVFEHEYRGENKAIDVSANQILLEFTNTHKFRPGEIIIIGTDGDGFLSDRIRIMYYAKKEL